MAKLKLGKAEPAFGPTTAPTKLLSQSRLNELVEDWDAMYTALTPFARYAEILPAVIEGHPRATDSGAAFTGDRGLEQRIVTFGDLRQALKVLETVYARLEKRRIAQAERALAGHGDVCRLCGMPIEGSDDYELEGYCSKTCKREDDKSELPSPDPMFEVGPKKP